MEQNSFLHKKQSTRIKKVQTGNTMCSCIGSDMFCAFAFLLVWLILALCMDSSNLFWC